MNLGSWKNCYLKPKDKCNMHQPFSTDVKSLEQKGEVTLRHEATRRDWRRTSPFGTSVKGRGGYLSWHYLSKLPHRVSTHLSCIGLSYRWVFSGTRARTRRPRALVIIATRIPRLFSVQGHQPISRRKKHRLRDADQGHSATTVTNKCWS
ncbi:hypothetical protein TNCV_2280141 [Trichonephila clavipes]|nr:hypothetical protein TNCV_2280141 [Trichonephila clavipes]